MSWRPIPAGGFAKGWRSRSRALGRDHKARLVERMRAWSADSPFVQRAAAAGLCEPALLKHEADVADVLNILDRITSSMAASTERRSEGFKALRKAMGYCWSVAAAAAPSRALPYIEKWKGSADADVEWVIRTNLAKARMAGFSAATTTSR